MTLSHRIATEKSRVVVDGRLQGAHGTGVSAYAEAVCAGLRQTGTPVEVLTDSSRFGARDAPLVRGRRWLAASLNHARRARRAGGVLHAPDLFRLAQARFRRHGRLLDVELPGPVGVMHWTYPLPLRAVGWTNVYTVHDVIPLNRPDLSPVDPAGLGARLRAIMAAADAIITVSEHARQDILHVLAGAEDRVINAGAGLASLDAREGAVAAAGLVRGAYLVAPGIVEERKNLERLVTAWRRSAVALPLVIVGPDGAGGSDLRHALAAAGATVLPWQERADLVGLIAGARGLAFPSLAEGFGLPVAEAMALGVPVVTSCRGALAETAGDAALLVDPEDEAAIAAGLAALVNDAPLRSRLATAGRVRAAQWRPAAFGRRLKDAYAAAVAAGEAAAYRRALTDGAGG